jgi:rubrerythrin
LIIEEASMWEYLGVIGMILGSGYWVSYPLLEPRRSGSSAEASEDLLHELEAEKEEIYRAIKDMEFDYKMGKLSGDDYRNLSERYRAKAVESLKRIEEQAGREKDLAEEIEEEIEKEVLALRERPKKGEGFFCTQCGQKASPGDQFCSRCGRKLIMP